MGTKSKERGNSSQLTTKEKRILAMARRIEKEAKRIRRGLSPWFYRHGWVSVAEAAMRLGWEVKDVETRLRYWLAGDGGPEPKGTRMIPVSELRRKVEDRAESSLEELAWRMWKTLKLPLPEQLIPKSVSFDIRPIIPPKLDVAAIAERLKITPHAARQFINADGPVSLAAYHWGRSFVVTPEELAAFERTYGREILQARHARASRAA